jgi:hypothetical protein
VLTGRSRRDRADVGGVAVANRCSSSGGRRAGRGWRSTGAKATRVGEVSTSTKQDEVRDAAAVRFQGQEQGQDPGHGHACGPNTLSLRVGYRYGGTLCGLTVGAMISFPRSSSHQRSLRPDPTGSISYLTRIYQAGLIIPPLERSSPRHARERPSMRPIDTSTNQSQNSTISRCRLNKKTEFPFPLQANSRVCGWWSYRHILSSS